jgi:GH43 family beta-xylosidase
MMRKPNLFLLSLIWLCAGTFNCAAESQSAFFANPICEQADPWITQDGGRYVACFAEGNRAISIQVSEQLTALGSKQIIWTAPATGPASREIWAPELHRIGGHWYVYFAASDGQNKNHKAWVLKSESVDPLGPYSLHGPLYTGDNPDLRSENRWAIDLTVFELNGQRYAIWSGWPDERDIQYLYIAPMKDPLTLGATRVRICTNDDYVWERVGERRGERGLNEAPEVLQRGGRTFVTYSCSGSWQASYKLGMLELRAGGDPLKPGDWTKFPEPVFKSSAETYGVGHGSFVKSPDGTQDWLVYHAKQDRKDGWRRYVLAQPFHWDAKGLPLFGEPVAANQLLAVPSGEKRPEISGQQDYQFATTTDLTNWSYYGHHQMMALREGALRLGETPKEVANGYRSGEKVVLNGGNWRNFTATAQMRALEAKGEMGVLFRVQYPAVGENAQRGYYAGIKLGESRAVLGYMDGSEWHELASTPVSATANSAVEFTVSAKGSHIEASLNGKLLVQATDSKFVSGSVGLRVVGSQAAFTRLKITPTTEADAGAGSGFYSNPVYAASMPDPSVIRYGDYYYAAGTTGDKRTSDGRIFTLLKSRDLVSWEKLGGALNPPFPDSARQYWAPELASNDGKYYLYYCEGGIEPEKFALRVAVSDQPEGPYNDVGKALADCESNRFTIDPFPFRDDDGQWYLFYARNFTNFTAEVHPGTAIVVDRLVSMTQLAGDCRVVVRATQDWTLYEAHRKMDVYGKTFDWHTIEGPCVVKRAGRYYCFYSGANWQTPRYGVDYVVAESPLGPFSEGGNRARVLSGIPEHVRGPGHHSIVTGPDGRTQYVLYHAWDAGMTRRELCLDKLEWTEAGPRCVPTDKPQSMPKF